MRMASTTRHASGWFPHHPGSMVVPCRRSFDGTAPTCQRSCVRSRQGDTSSSPSTLSPPSPPKRRPASMPRSTRSGVVKGSEQPKRANASPPRANVDGRLLATSDRGYPGVRRVSRHQESGGFTSCRAADTGYDRPACARVVRRSGTPTSIGSESPELARVSAPHLLSSHERNAERPAHLPPSTSPARQVVPGAAR